MKAEYVAVSDSVKELIWLKRWLSDVANLETPYFLVANVSAVKLLKNPEYHKKIQRCGCEISVFMSEIH